MRGKPSAEKWTVVFADNDRLLREAVGDFLRAKGMKVHVAEDGLKALQLIRAVKPDLVVLDIIMPKLSGARVCRLLRQDSELGTTPVIAFSSLNAEDFRWFPDLSADAYVAKAHLPVAFEHLSRAIDGLTSKSAGPLASGLFGYSRVPASPIMGEVFEERQRLLDLVNALGRGIVELDVDGRILWVSTDATKLLGERDLNLIGELFGAGLTPDDQAPVQALIADAVKAEAPSAGHATVTLASGQRVSLEVRSILNHDECRGVVIVMEAVSDGAPAAADAPRPAPAS